MKHNIILFWGMMVSFPVFSQNSEIREAEKLISKQNFEEAIPLLYQAYPLIRDQEEDEQRRLYHYLGAASLKIIDSGLDNERNNTLAIQSLNKVLEVEAKLKSRRYSDRTEPLIQKLLSIWTSQATNLNKEQKYIIASRKFMDIYQLSKKDTLFIYYAAGAALNGKDFDFAESRYKDLINLKFNGSTTLYTALHLKSNRVESFGKDKRLRDAMVRKGTYADPKTIEEGSKLSEIYKNLSMILMGKKNYSEAEFILLDAYKANKQDEIIVLALIELYEKTNRPDMLERYISEAKKLDSENSFIPYNLGILAYNNQNFDDANKYFEQASKITETADNAYLMLANILLLKDASITSGINEMSHRPNSSEYKKRFQEKKDLYNEALILLNKSLEINSNNKEVISLVDEINNFLKD